MLFHFVIVIVIVIVIPFCSLKSWFWYGQDCSRDDEDGRSGAELAARAP